MAEIHSSVQILTKIKIISINVVNIPVYLPINRRAIGCLCIVIYSLKYEELESWPKVCSYLTSGGAFEMCDALLNYVCLAQSQNYVGKTYLPLKQ